MSEGSEGKDTQPAAMAFKLRPEEWQGGDQLNCSPSLYTHTLTDSMHHTPCVSFHDLFLWSSSPANIVYDLLTYFVYCLSLPTRL